MEIIVEGRGRKFFKPDEVEVTLNFETIDKSYKSVLEKGVENVRKYFDVLKKMGFKQEDIKTRSFRVAEKTKYDNVIREYLKVGFSFEQTASLKFDYDTDRLAEFMEVTSKCENAPRYWINFGVKDEKAVNEEILGLAFKDAEFQANAIAKASGTEIQECLKISFEPFDDKVRSETRFDGAFKCCSADSTREDIAKTFVPEDIELSMSIYCKFIAK